MSEQVTKSAIIFTNQEECRLFIGDGDWHKFEQVWVNIGSEDHLWDELSDRLYDSEGNFLPFTVTTEEFT